MTNDPRIGERLGAYVLHEKLGEGGMAVVYRGERVGEAGFKKKVAIKRMLPQYRRDASLLERFAAEARTNARLDHPNLVQVLDFGIEPEPYLVLELVEGVSLSQIMQRLLARRERLEISAMLFIAAEVANGLDHAHRKKGDDGAPLGIVHRDVSPQNVLVSNEGAVKVSDFGLVKAADNVLKTASGVSIGKLSYMAPEQADGRDVDARADLFSLGVTMWEMLTLRSLIPPDDAARAARALQEGGFAPPSRYRDEVPDELDRLVLQCLAVDPEARIPSAQQLALELREMLHERAAGYDRQQLARLVAWLFPEKGWGIPEPEVPAAQPTAEERASMPPVTPATVALARRAEADAAQAPREKEKVARPSLEPGRVTGPLLISAHFETLGLAPAGAMRVSHPASEPLAANFEARASTMGGAQTHTDEQGPALGATGRHASTTGSVSAPTEERRGRWRAWLIGVLATVSVGLGSLGVLGLGVTAWHWWIHHRRGSLRVESATPGARVYLGPVLRGPAPVTINRDELVGQPVIVVAPGHEPQILRAERVADLTHESRHVERVELVPSERPSTILYVRYDGQGVAYSNEVSGVLGTVPGALRLRDGSASSLVILDEVSGRIVEVQWRACEAGALCVLDAR